MTTWKCLSIIKSLPNRKSSTKQSTIQHQQNITFRAVMDFLWSVRDVINIGFQLRRKSSMTPMNSATSFHMLNTIVGDPDEPCLDLAKIKFSQPIQSTQRAWNAALFAEEGRKIKITWELNPFPLKCTQLDDHAIFVMYDKDMNWFQEFIPRQTNRDTLVFEVIAPKQCIDHEWFAYMFFVSDNRKLVSETEFLGMVKVQA